MAKWPLVSRWLFDRRAFALAGGGALFLPKPQKGLKALYLVAGIGAVVAALVTVSLLGVPGPTATPTATPASSPVDFLVLIPEGVTLQVGQSQQFAVTAYDRVENPIPSLTYVFGVRQGVGRIDSQGIFVAGTMVGTYEGSVTVEVIQGSVTKRATADVTITRPLQRPLR